jgi:hypothetical protein
MNRKEQVIYFVSELVNSLLYRGIDESVHLNETGEDMVIHHDGGDSDIIEVPTLFEVLGILHDPAFGKQVMPIVIERLRDAYEEIDELRERSKCEDDA